MARRSDISRDERVVTSRRVSGDASTVEDRLRLLESSVRGIVMEVDQAGRYLEIWTHDESLLARPRQELLGSTISEVLGQETGATFLELIRVALAEQRPVRYQYQLEVLAGTRWFSCEGVPGRRPGTVVLRVQDITEQRRFEAQLIESDRLASIGLLAGGVGHEINNPLAWIMTHLRTVQRELAGRVKVSADPQLEKWFAQLGQVLEGAERIRQIVTDLSFFTYSPEEPHAPIDVRAALDWAADIAMAELRHRARLSKQYADAPLVTGSEARLGQVFLNLLINSAHSVEPGNTQANEVRVELSTDNQGRARVDVVDTGRGILIEHRARLFEPFFTTKPRGSGTGLGLSVSRRIVESYGGSLELVSSRPGETRFRVTLPPAPATAMNVVAAEPPEKRPGRRLRVMIVDDQPHFLTSLRMALQDDFDLATEGSAKAALARVRGGERFDSIVCDLMMPDVTGMDFYDALARDNSELLDRMVFMTGGAYTERAQKFLTAVSNERIQKPFPPEKLEALLLRLCEDGRPREREKIVETSWRTLTPFVDDVLKEARGDSLEEVAQALAKALLERFSGSVVLARMYVTATEAELPAGDKAFVAELARAKRAIVTTSTPILSLIATAGTQPAWNDRRLSRGHRGIPLVSDAFVQQIPMIARLLTDLGVELKSLDTPDAGMSVVRRDWAGLFHVPDARTTKDQLGRLIIPDQDFVAEYGVKTVFGIGGAYPGGRIAVLILFTKETVPREIAERFLPIIAQFKVATMGTVNDKLYRT